MDYSKLTKEQIIEGIKNRKIDIIELSEELRDDKDVIIEAVRIYRYALCDSPKRFQDDIDIVLEAVKNSGKLLYYASERLQNDKGLLELLEKEDASKWNVETQIWYKERMEVLANIRDKELMEDFIPINNKAPKKLKF